MELQQALEMSSTQQPSRTQNNAGHHFFDDWNLARTLQALEFEFTNEEIAAQAVEGDFTAKEYKASRSCRRQLVTFSFVICLLQVLKRVNMYSNLCLLHIVYLVDRCVGGYDSIGWL